MDTDHAEPQDAGVTQTGQEADQGFSVSGGTAMDVDGGVQRDQSTHTEVSEDGKETRTITTATELKETDTGKERSEHTDITTVRMDSEPGAYSQQHTQESKSFNVAEQSTADGSRKITTEKQTVVVTKKHTTTSSEMADEIFSALEKKDAPETQAAAPMEGVEEDMVKPEQAGKQEFGVSFGGGGISLGGFSGNISGGGLSGGLGQGGLFGNVETPSFSASGPEAHVSGDASGAGGGSGGVSGGMDISGQVPEGGISGGISGGGISGGEISGGWSPPDISGGFSGGLSGPEISGELPSGSVSGPGVSGGVSSDGQVPDFGISGGMSGPGISGGWSGPSGDIDVSGPQMSGDMPGVDVSGPGVSGDISGPVTGGLPSGSITGPQISGGVSSDGMSGELPHGTFSGPGISGGVSGPGISGGLPSGEGSGGITMGGDMSGQLPSATLSGPGVSGGMSGGVPSKDMGGQVKMGAQLPSIQVEGDAGAAGGAHVGTPKAKFSLFGKKGGKDKSLERKPKKSKNHPEAELDVSHGVIVAENLDINLPEGKFDSLKRKGHHTGSPREVVLEDKVVITEKQERGVIEMPEEFIEGDVNAHIRGMSPFRGKSPFRGSPFAGKKKIKGEVELEGGAGDKGDVTLRPPSLNLDDRGADKKDKKEKHKSHLGIFGKGEIDTRELELDSPDLKHGASMDFDDPEVGIQLEGGDELRKPSIDIEGPEVAQHEGDLEGAHFSFGGQIKMPDISFKGPSFEGPEITLPSASGGGDIDAKTGKPKVTVKQSVKDDEGDRHSKSGSLGRKFKMPGFHFKGPKFGFKGKGDADVDVSGPDADIHGKTKIKLEGPDIDVKKPRIEGGGDVNMAVAGPDIGGGVDIHGPDANIHGGAGGKIAVDQELEVKEPKGKGGFHVKGPKFNMPSIKFGGKGGGKSPDASLEGGGSIGGDIDVQGPHADVDIRGPTTDINLGGPDVDITGGNQVHVDEQLEVKDPKAKGGFHIKGPKFNMPSIKFGGKAKGPDADVEGGGSVGGDIDIHGPDVHGPGADIDVRGPDVDIGGGGKMSVDEELEVKGPKGKGGFNIKGPKFNMPSIHFGGKGKGPDVDVEGGGSIGGDVDIHGPDANVDGPGGNIDVHGPDMDIGGSGGGKVSVDEELEVKGPKGKGGFHIKGPKFDMPSIKFGGKGKGPDVEGGGSIGGDVDIRGPDIHGPDMDVDGQGDIDIRGPNVDMDVSGPDMDISGGGKVSVDEELEVKGPKGKGGFNIKGPKFNMPSIHFGGKGKGPDVEGGGSIGGDVDIHGPDANVDGHGGVHGPDMDISGSTGGKVSVDEELEVKGPKGKGGFHIKGPKFNMPSIKFGGKGKGPDVEGGGSIGGDVDIHGPDANVDGHGGVDIKGPSGNIDVHGPDMDISGSGGGKVSVDEELEVKGPKGKGGFHIKGPKFNMPSVKFGGKGKGPDVEGGGSIGGDVDIRGPDIHGPDMDVDGQGDIDIRGPNVDMDVSGPDMDISGGGKVSVDEELEVRGPKGKGGFNIKGPKFNMPSIHFGGKGKGPDVEGGGSIGGDVDIHGPDANVDGHGGVHGPDMDISGSTGGKVSVDEELEIKGPKGKGKGGFNIKGPKFNMPSIKFGGKGKGPDVEGGGSIGGDVDIRGPDIHGPDMDVDGQGDIDIRGPNVDMDVSGPDMDISGGGKVSVDEELEVKGPKGKGGFNIKGPKFNMPSIHFGGKGKGPDVEGGGRIGGDVDIRGPDIHGPDMDVDGQGDIDIRGPNVDMDVSGPDMDISGGGKVSVDEELEVKGPKGKGGFNIKGPKFNMPSIHFGGKGKGPDVEGGGSIGGDVDIHGPDMDVDGKGDIDIRGPNVDMDVSGPDMDIRGGGQVSVDEELEVKGPKGKGGFNIKGPKFDMPSIKFGGKGKGPDVEGGGSIGGDVDIHGPDADVDGHGGVDIRGPSGNIDVHGPDMDISGSGGGKVSVDEELEVKGPKGKGGFHIKGPKFNMPSIHFGGKGKGPDADVEGGGSIGGDIDVKGPDVDIHGPSGDIEGPDIGGKGKIDIEGPDASLDIKGPKIDIKGKKPKRGVSPFRFGGKQNERYVGGSIEVHEPQGGGEFDGDMDSDAGSKKGSLGRKFKFGGFKFGGKHDTDHPSAKLDVDIPGGQVKVTEPDTDIDVKGPKVDVDLDVRGPRGDIDIQGPHGDVDIKGPEGQIQIGTPDLDIKGKGKKHKFKMPGLKGSGKANVTVEETDELRIGPGDKDSDAGSKKGTLGRKFKFGGFFKGSGDADVKGPDIRGPDMDIDGRGDIDIKGPKVDVNISGPDADISGGGKISVDEELEMKEPKGKGGFHIKGPKFNMPSIKFGGKAKGPDADIDAGGHIGGDVDIQGPKMDVDVSGPDADIQGPDISGGGNVDVNVDSPDIDGKRKGFNIKGPKFNLPSFGFGGKGDADVDVQGPDGKGSIDIKGPSAEADISGGGKVSIDEELEMKDPKGKGGFNIKGPKFNMPSIHFGGKGPDADFDAHGPDVDVDGKAGVDIRGPSAEVDVSGPDVGGGGKVSVDQELEVKDPKGKGGFHIKGPNINMPSIKFGGKGKGPGVEGGGSIGGDVDIRGPDIHGPDMDVDGQGDIDIRGPNVDMDVSGPDMDISGGGKVSVDEELEVKGPKGKGGFNIKGPKFNMPSIHFGGKGKGPDVEGGGSIGGDVDIRGPDIHGPDMDVDGRGGVDIKGPNVDMDVSGPDMDISGGGKISVDEELEMKDPKGKGGFHIKGPKFNMPSIHFGGKGKGPDVNVEGGGSIDGDVDIQGPDIHGPNADVDMDISGPDVDVSGGGNVSVDEQLEVKGPKGKGGFNIKGPKFNMPSIKFGGKGKGPDASIDGPHVEGDVDIRGPDADVDGQGGIDIKGPKVDMDVSGPDVDISGGGKLHVDEELEVKGPKGKGGFHIKGPKFNMPSIKFGGKAKGGDIDGGGSIGGDVDVKGPDVDIKGPKMDINVTGPDADIHGPDVDVHGGARADIEGPDVDIDGKKPKKGFHFKGPKFNLPSFGFGGKGGGKSPDVHVKGGGRINADADVPDVDINGGADIDVGGPEIGGGGKQGEVVVGASLEVREGQDSPRGFNIKGPKFNLPSVKLGGKGKGPDVDIEGRGDIDVNGPDADLDGHGGVDIKGPKFDMDVSGPDVDIGGGGNVHVDEELEVKDPKGKGGFHIKGPKFNMPSIHLGGKGKGDLDVDGGGHIDGDIDVQGPDADIKGPKVDINVRGPDADFEGPEGNIHGGAGVDIEGPDVDGKKKGFHFKGPKFNMPSFGFGGKGDGDIDVNGPDGHGPDVDIDGKADVDIKGPNVDINVTGPDADISGGGKVSVDEELEVKGPKGKGGFNIKGPKFNMPSINIGGKGKGDVDGSGHVGADVDVHGPDFDVKGPKVDIDVRGPDADINGPSGDADINMGGKGKIDVEGPSGGIDIKGPKIDIKGKKRRGKSPFRFGGKQGQKIVGDTDEVHEGHGGDVDIDLPRIDTGGKKGGSLGRKFKLGGFKFGGKHDPDRHSADIEIKGPKGDFDIEGPEGDMSIKGPKGDIDVRGPKGGIDVHGPGGDIDIKGPSGDIDIKGPSGDVDIRGPHADIDIQGPEGKIDVDSPDVDISGKGGKKHKFKMPSIGLKGSGKGNVTVEEMDELRIGPGDKDSDAGSKKGTLGRKFKFGGFFKGGAKGDTPGVSVDVKGPEGDVSGPDLDISGPSGDIDIRGPSGGIDVKGPSGDFDIKGPSGGVDIHGPSGDVDIKGPSGDIDIKGPSGDIDIRGPSGDIDIKGPSVDIDVDGPQGDVDGHGGGKFGIKLPKFHTKQHPKDVTVEEMDELRIQAGGDIDVRGPDGSADLDISGTPKSKKFKIKMPHIGFGGGKHGDVDIDAGAKGGIDVDGPGGRVDVKGPDVDISGGADIRGPQVDWQGGYQAPDVDGSGQIVMPSGDIDLRGPQVKGDIPGVDVTLSGPHVEGPDGSVDVEGPDLDGSGSGKGSLKIKGPKMKLPGFHFGGKGKQPEFVTGENQKVAEDQKMKGGVSVSGPDVDVSGHGGIEGPDVRLEGGVDPGQVKLSGPAIDVKGGGGIDVSGPEAHISAKDKRNTPGKRLMALFQTDKNRDSGADFNVDVKAKKRRSRSRSSSSRSSSSSEASGKKKSLSYKKKFHLPHFKVKGDKSKEKDKNRHSLNVSADGSKGSIGRGTPSPSKSRKKFFTFGGFGKKSPKADISIEGKAEKYPDDKEDFIPMEVDSHDSIQLPGLNVHVSGGLDATDATQAKDLPGAPGSDSPKARGRLDAQGQHSIQLPSFELPSFSVSGGFSGGLDVSGDVITKSSAEEQHAEAPSFNLEGEMPLGVSTPKSHKGPGSPHIPSMADQSFETGIEAGLSTSLDSGTASDPSRHVSQFVVVAIDFGTTYSGYAFSFTHDPTSIHMMRKWEGGDPGVINQKTPTCLLLSPEGKFHSFGFTARDFYHDLDPEESREWLYFDKFKMALHYMSDLNEGTTLHAVNGQDRPALEIFSHALRYFKEHALQQMKDQSSTNILNEDVRWVITVPAIWKAEAKQFMRRAAYDAGIASPTYPDQLLIALEPEAASIYCRKLRLYELMHDKPAELPLSPKDPDITEELNSEFVSDKINADSSVDTCDFTIPDIYYQQPEWAARGPLTTTSSLNATIVGTMIDNPGTRYIVVDCGGGTVDITVHEILNRQGNLKELYRATGGPYGSIGVDQEFENLLVEIFGTEFIEAFRHKRPAGYVDLMIAFESRKRAASPYKTNPLNISLPFSFIDFYKKWKGGGSIETAIRKHGNNDVRWSTQGMMRLMPEAMKRLFDTTLENIRQAIGEVLSNPKVTDIEFMFLVGGFAESPMLRANLEEYFGEVLRIMSPSDVGLSILKGAVHFGLDPTVVNVRRSRMTYGVGVLNRFREGMHPESKRVAKDGQEWCTDVFDMFVCTDQPVALGDTVLRSYTPAKRGQKSSIINIYSSERSDIHFITDPGVRKCGTLYLDLSALSYDAHLPKRREIQTRMIFGDTEIKVSALDVATNTCVGAAVDFLNK